MQSDNLFSQIRNNMAVQSALSRNAKILRYVTYAGVALVVAATLAGLPAADLPGVILLVATGVPFALALWELSRMLGRAEQGEIFSQPTIAHLRRFALFVLVTAIISIFLPPIVAIAAALWAAEGLEHVVVSFEGGDVFILLISALLFFVARLFEEAQRIADENRQIV